MLHNVTRTGHDSTDKRIPAVAFDNSYTSTRLNTQIGIHIHRQLVERQTCIYSTIHTTGRKVLNRCEMSINCLASEIQAQNQLDLRKKIFAQDRRRTCVYPRTRVAQVSQFTEEEWLVRNVRGTAHRDSAAPRNYLSTHFQVLVGTAHARNKVSKTTSKRLNYSSTVLQRTRSTWRWTQVLDKFLTPRSALW